MKSGLVRNNLGSNQSSVGKGNQTLFFFLNFLHFSDSWLVLKKDSLVYLSFFWIKVARTFKPYASGQNLITI